MKYFLVMLSIIFALDAGCTVGKNDPKYGPGIKLFVFVVDLVLSVSCIYFTWR